MPDYWASWAVGQFGDPAVAAAVASAMVHYDSFALPRPVQWTTGPGSMVPDVAQCGWAGVYAWVDGLVGLRGALLASISGGRATLDNLEAFE